MDIGNKLSDKKSITAEKQQENPVLACAATAREASRSTENQQPAEQKQKKRTVGNIIYDFGIYGSTAWLGVAAMSLVVGYEAIHGKNKHFNWLRSYRDYFSTGLSKFFSKVLPKSVDPETVDGLAKGSTMFATLGLGGTSLMPPLKWMEDNREKNACRIDTVLGTTPPDPETIKAEPKQTWKSVLSGRLFSWGMSYVAFLAMGPKLTNKLSKWFGEKATAGWMHMRPGSDAAYVRKWADIGAFDALFTVITATLTYGASRFVASKRNRTMSSQDVMLSIDPGTPAPLEPFTHPLPTLDEPDETKQTFSERVQKTSRPAFTTPAADYANTILQQQQTLNGALIGT